MIKRYHEAPLDVFSKVQQLTDGDYALVHLFETNKEYFKAFKNAVESGRDVILDNSIFELGTSFNHDRYAYWINQLKPTWYIVPDVWKDGPATTEMFFEFFAAHPKETLCGKVIGVAQGHTLDEVVQCYKAIEPHCDMIAFNFDFSSYATEPKVGVPKRLLMSLGRFKMLQDLQALGVVNIYKPHHLLGCGVPQEICWYPTSWSWVRSMDTCHPVMEAMVGRRYDSELPGQIEKDPTKMCNMMDAQIDDLVWADIEHNLKCISSWEALRPAF